MGEDEIRAVVRAALEEFVSAQPDRSAELEEERKRRETLEARVNELVAENARSRAAAQEAERSAAIRAELQRLGVAKIDLAYKAVKDDLAREGVDMREYLTRFAAENPELLPARLAGGSGASAGQKQPGASGTVDLEKIRPGMSPEEMERVRQEIARVAMQTLRGI
jgi:hypothetical protein